MPLMEEITLTDSIEVRAAPEEVFGFIARLADDESYRAWHPEDHVSLRWIEGPPWEEGSVAYAEEYLHGKLHKLKFTVTKVVPNRRIEYGPTSRLMRRYFPGNAFIMEPAEEGCVFTATVKLRVGRLARILAGGRLQRGLADTKQHMREEGENLKKIVEA